MKKLYSKLPNNSSKKCKVYVIATHILEPIYSLRILYMKCLESKVIHILHSFGFWNSACIYTMEYLGDRIQV